MARSGVSHSDPALRGIIPRLFVIGYYCVCSRYHVENRSEKTPMKVVNASQTKYTGAMGSRIVEAEYEKGVLKPSTPLALRPGERVHLIVMRQPDPKRWDLSRLAQSSAADEAVLTEQGLEGWAANLDEEDR